MVRNRSRFAGLIFLATILASAPAALAQQKADDPVERARLHYERGLQLFNEENYDAALFEFERAYELAPSYQILYNMGRIQRQQNNYAAALRSYARYIKEGGTSIPADRREEVEREIGVLRPRTAQITVVVNVDGADVNTDDIPVCTATIESSCVGKSPLAAPIVVNPGRHKITAVKPGYQSAMSLVSVVGSDQITVKLELQSLTRPKEYSNPWVVPTIIGWSATGAAAASAGLFGILSLGAKDDQDSMLDSFGRTDAELADARDKTQTLSTVSDILWISTGVFAAASAYLTIRMIGEKRPEGEDTGKRDAAKINVSPFGVYGKF
jgi:hypothetical protein